MRVPEFEMAEPPFMVIVPAEGVKVPDTVSVPAPPEPTVAVWVPLEIVPLIVRL